ncbi:MAG: PAS domain S-box protein [Deltaproteobacteria bacterium]|nr:PAS domain S-box protein [Deltaproteobacteria bacterium]
MPYGEYFKAASESLIVASKGGSILEVNPKTNDLFGYGEGELIGQPVEVLLPARLHAAHRNHVERFFQTPRTRAMGVGLSLIGRRKDGSEFPVEVSLTYASNTRRGEVVVAALIDITQRLAMEGEARRAEALTSLGTIAAGIAHDLNNPLQIIISRAELMLASSSEAVGSEAQEDLAVIHRNAQRAGRIVEEFLRVSTQQDRALGSIDLNQIINNMLLLVRPQLRQAQIEVQSRLAPNLPVVLGDPTAIERILINLVTNARDSMPSGGKLTIETGDGSLRPGWVHVRVIDTGSGIEPDSLNKVFDLKFTTKREGSGLGLWLSRRIVHEHNGRIDVQSEIGKGTTFTIAIPPIEGSK